MVAESGADSHWVMLKSDLVQYVPIIHDSLCGPMISGHKVLNGFANLPIYAGGIVEYNRYSHFASVL